VFLFCDLFWLAVVVVAIFFLSKIIVLFFRPAHYPDYSENYTEYYHARKKTNKMNRQCLSELSNDGKQAHDSFSGRATELSGSNLNSPTRLIPRFEDKGLFRQVRCIWEVSNVIFKNNSHESSSSSRLHDLRRFGETLVDLFASVGVRTRVLSREVV
jgi:hypothetical protein